MIGDAGEWVYPLPLIQFIGLQEELSNMSVNVTEKNLEEKKKEAEKNTYTAYEIAEYYYFLADYEKAVKWYEKAASGSPVVPMALYAMGYACQNGEGTAVDLFRAAQFYEAAAEKDIPQACYNLAFFYQNGIGVCRDLNKANRYCEKASECLKRLADAAQEAKEELHRVNLSHTQLIDSVLENEKKWRAVGDESAQKSHKIGELEALTDDYSKTVLELKRSIESKEKELTFEEERYERLSSLLRETLGLIDRLNDDIRSFKRQIDELNARHLADVSQNAILSGKISRLEIENSQHLQSQEKKNKQLLDSQKQLFDLNNKAADLTTSVEGLQRELKILQIKEKKTKMQRNMAWVYSMASTAGILACCYYFFV